MANATPRPSRYPCPVCPAGVLSLSMDMEDHTIYTCGGYRCGAFLWVPTDHGQLIKLTEELRIARIKFAAKIRKMAADDN